MIGWLFLGLWAGLWQAPSPQLAYDNGFQHKLSERRVSSIVAPALCLAMVSGCAKVEHRWKEEVLLSDGSIVDIDRQLSTVANTFVDPAMESTGGPQFLRYRPSGVEWATDPRKPYQQPIAFDIIDGKAILVVAVGAQREFCTAGITPGTYTAEYYTWVNHKIRALKQDEVPLSRMFLNLNYDNGATPGLPGPTHVYWRNKSMEAGNNFSRRESVDAFFLRSGSTCP